MWENSMSGKCTPPPCKPMQTCHPLIFFGGIVLTTRTPLCELPPLILRRHALNVYPLQNDPPAHCTVRGGSQLVGGGFGLWAYLPESEEGLRGPRSAALGKLGSGAPHSPFGHVASGRGTRLLL